MALRNMPVRAKTCLDLVAQILPSHQDRTFYSIVERPTLRPTRNTTLYSYAYIILKFFFNGNLLFQ